MITALAYGQDVAFPCLMPQLNMVCMFACRVSMSVGMLVSVSAAHSMYPCGGQPCLAREVHTSSQVSRSKYFSSSLHSMPR